MASKTKEKNKNFLNKKRSTTLGNDMVVDEDFMKKFNWWDYKTEKNIVSKLIASCKNSNLVFVNNNDKNQQKNINQILETHEKNENDEIELDEEKKKLKILGNFKDLNSKIKETLFIYRIVKDKEKTSDLTEFYSLKEVLEFLKIRCGFKHELLVFKDDESRNLFLHDMNKFLEKYSQ